MGTGYLKVETRAAGGAIPIAGARVQLLDLAGQVLFEAYTDQNGETPPLELPAPDKSLTLDPGYTQPANSAWIVVVTKAGFVQKRIRGVEVVDTQTSILTVQMQPDIRGNSETEETIIPPIGLLADDRSQVGNKSGLGQRVLSEVTIPNAITVHLGKPADTGARNVRVPFADYIKNVVSSEIYPTWPTNAIVANIHAIVTFALNRVYTEWYRSRGYNFEITNSTAFDQSYREGGQVFENISRLVDDYFNVYVHRLGFKNPFFTSFCNGTTVICAGLAQWGTVELANQGRTPIQILRDYYPSDIQLSAGTHFSDVVVSYPGYSLGIGSRGSAVQTMQNYLNRIRVNYPLIPRIDNPDGVFGEETRAAVLAFQKTFNLPQDGVIGRDTWNKISNIYVAVTKLGELESEGERIGIGQEPPRTTITQGARGPDVLQLQFILNAVAAYYESIPVVIQDGVFDARTKNAVTEFQKVFGLTQDGVVGPSTWRMLYQVYHSIFEQITPPPPPPPPPIVDHPYPGKPLRDGSTGADVRLIQSCLNAIGKAYPNIPRLTVDGVFGPKTQAAVVAFQQQFMLGVDGVVGPVTWEAIIRQYDLLTGGAQADNLEYPGRPLKVGMRGDDVRLMQGFLAELAACHPVLIKLDVDGVFGPHTEHAVKVFQERFELTVDGIIGPVTWYAIIEEVNAVRC
ncbi:MAG: peptidoglycan-binding protein [Oscillospiraceae bacterium]|nr:peptidoglycan-binding protein [Oscillospiraceae bacterium]